MIGELRSALEAVAVADDAVPMQAYMKDIAPYLGVKTPARRAASKATIRSLKGASGDDLILFAEQCWREPEREFQYVGCDALGMYRAALDMSHLGDVRDLITAKSWWDTVDALAPNVVASIVFDEPHGWRTVDSWIDEDNMWLARSSILQQLKYKTATNQDILFDRCLRRGHDKQFFIRKAIGWALRNHSYVAPVSVRDFVAEHLDQLQPLSIKEATRRLRAPT